MAAVSNYLDFFNIFVNELVGNLNLAIVLLFIVLLWVGVRFGIPFRTVMLFVMIAIAGFMIKSNSVILWSFMLLFVGLFTGSAVIKKLNQSS